MRGIWYWIHQNRNRKDGRESLSHIFRIFKMFYPYICKPSCFEKNFLYVYGACCCCSLCCFSSVIIIFLNGKSAILHLYSLYIKSKERLTKATKWDMFHVWKVCKIIMMIILMMHDIDRCICKTCTKNRNILATSFNPLIT